MLLSHFTGGNSEEGRLCDLPQATQQIHARPRIKIQQHLTSGHILKPWSLLPLEDVFACAHAYLKQVARWAFMINHCTALCSTRVSTHTQCTKVAKHRLKHVNLKKSPQKSTGRSAQQTFGSCVLLLNFKQSSNVWSMKCFVLCQQTQRILFKSVFSCPFACWSKCIDWPMFKSRQNFWLPCAGKHRLHPWN